MSTSPASTFAIAKRKLRSFTAVDGPSIDRSSCCDILERCPTRIEDQDFVVPRAPGFQPRQDFAKLRVHAFCRHDALRDCVMQIADRSALLRQIGNDGTG